VTLKYDRGGSETVVVFAPIHFFVAVALMTRDRLGRLANVTSINSLA